MWHQAQCLARQPGCQAQSLSQRTKLEAQSQTRAEGSNLSRKFKPPKKATSKQTTPHRSIQAHLEADKPTSKRTTPHQRAFKPTSKLTNPPRSGLTHTEAYKRTQKQTNPPRSGNSNRLASVSSIIPLAERKNQPKREPNGMCTTFIIRHT